MRRTPPLHPARLSPSFRHTVLAHASLAILLWSGAAAAHAQFVTVPARKTSFQPKIHAWARVRNVAPLQLTMPLAARVARITVVQGQAVAAGKRLVKLSGPKLTAAIATAEARVVAAHRELASAREAADSVKRRYPALADRQALASAQAALTAAQGKLAEAWANARALRQQRWLKSPVAAVVDAVHAAPGSYLTAGAPLLTLSPHGHLWLKAELFGKPLTAGTEGQFVPDQGAAVTVHLVSELPDRAADGARVLNLAPTAANPVWQAGETGVLTVEGASVPAVEVPAAALVLAAGHWYVLSDSGGKLKSQRVTPGPSRGGQVMILKGLAPGTRVVVRQAYLLFHRDIAAHYTPPD